MDLSSLQPVYGHDGPYVSVYVNVSRDAEDAAKAIEVRWRNARAELTGRDVDDATLRALDEVIGRDDDEGGPRGQIVFAASGSVLFDVLVATPPQNYAVRVGPLPDPTPYLMHRDSHVPHLRVVCDSIGADIGVVDDAGRLYTSKVAGDDKAVHKPRGGGEHHKQMQRAVDEQVKSNAKETASEIERLAAGAGGRLVVLAGEPKARRVVIEVLPDGLRPRVLEAESGSRASGLADSGLSAEIAKLLDDHGRRQVHAVVDDYQRERGNEGRATEGLGPTVEALRRGEVDTLLWSRSPGSTPDTVWIGPAPEMIGLTREDLEDLGVGEPVSEEVEPALVRAAAGTGAGLVLVDPDLAELHDGVGALLRVDDPALPA